MTDPQAPPVLPPSPPPPPSRGSTALFVLGVGLGLAAAMIPAVLIALVMAQWGSNDRSRSILACVFELVGFGIMVWIAKRSGKHGLTQGVIVGGALAFLLCAACWGIVALGG